MARSTRMDGIKSEEQFNVSCQDLELLMQTHNHDGIDELQEKFGGLQGLEKLLRSNLLSGLTGDTHDLLVRRIIFGRNEIPSKSPKSFFRLMFEAMQDVTLIILMICAALSFALTFYPSDQQLFEHQFQHSNVNRQRLAVENHCSSHFLEEVNIEWIESAAIIIAVFVVIFVTAFNDWSKEKQFRGLQSKIEDDQKFNVIRNDRCEQIQVKDIVVGDICQVKYGDLLPADGLIIQSNDLKIDESSLTGESELTLKTAHRNPFLLSGRINRIVSRSYRFTSI
jgi:P-type Ca2+ transporter type 2B